ncbi:MAG: hypothetical protein C0597_05905 [Marinilabiliales bacterium]|nr:MAG: hypothetical protein C0597_05905 [Marinilabiliales bacterium]
MKSLSYYFAIFFISLSAIVNAQESFNIDEVTNNIYYKEFSKHLEYLASDELKGRDTGSEGYAKAAEYIAQQFKNSGLEPFGDDNTYFQRVPMLKQFIDESSISFYMENNSGKKFANYGEDISFLINPDLTKVDQNQQMVFVGYGIIDSSMNINDYEGLDVKGKTVIAALGAPKKFKDYNSFDPIEKVQAAISQGAEGLILFYPKGFFQKIVYGQMHKFLDQPTITLNDTILKERMFEFDLKIAAFAHKDYINEVFKLNHLNLSKDLKKISKGEKRSKELKSNVICKYEIKTQNMDCKNVVAIIPGEDKNLIDEYFIVGAHLDHVGVGTEVKGDSIYNGMWDNATGSATLLSMAKTYRDAGIKPKRSLVFVCYTGEEKGLLGSTYFANKKDFDGNMVANLNIDMLGGLFPTKDIIPMGYSHSTLSEAVDYSAKKLNFIVDDNKEEENEYLFRSDQASFLQLGVPVINVANGYTAVDPKLDGFKEIEKWMKKKYHSPFDDLNQDYSQEAFYKAIKLSFLITYYSTNVLEEIKWNEDSWIFNRYVLQNE